MLKSHAACVPALSGEKAFQKTGSAQSKAPRRRNSRLRRATGRSGSRQSGYSKSAAPDHGANRPAGYIHSRGTRCSKTCASAARIPYGAGDIRIIEVLQKCETKDVPEPDCHIRVSGEVKEDLKRIGKRAHPCDRAARSAGSAAKTAVAISPMALESSIFSQGRK